MNISNDDRQGHDPSDNESLKTIDPACTVYVPHLRGGGNGKKKKKKGSDSDEDFNPESDLPQAMPSGLLIAPAQKRGGRRTASRAVPSSAVTSRADAPDTAAVAGSPRAARSASTVPDSDADLEDSDDQPIVARRSSSKQFLTPVAEPEDSDGQAVVGRTSAFKRTLSSDDDADNSDGQAVVGRTSAFKRTLSSDEDLDNSDDQPLVGRASSSKHVLISDAELDDSDDLPLAVPAKPPVKRQRVASAHPTRRPRDDSAMGASMSDSAASWPEKERKDAPIGKVWTDYDTYNSMKVHNALEGMKLELSKALVTPIIASNSRSSVDALLALPKIHDYQSRVDRAGGSRARDPPTWSLVAIDSESSIPLVFARLLQSEYTQQESSILCQELVNILNRWTGDCSLVVSTPTQYRMASKAANCLIKACRIKFLPNKPIQCHLPKMMRGKPGDKNRQVRENRFYVDICALNPSSFEEIRDNRLATIDMVEHVDFIPEASERFEFVTFGRANTTTLTIKKEPPSPGEEPTFQSVLPPPDELNISDDEREGLLKCERLLRLYSCAASLHGRISDRRGLRELFEGIVEKYGGKVLRPMALGGTGRGLFRGHDLYNVLWDHNQKTSMYPSRPLLDDLRSLDPSYTLPSIVVRSPHRGWMLAVEQVVTDTWLFDGDIRIAWTRGAEVADEINKAIRDGDTPPFVCLCTEDEVDTVIHPCAHCGRKLPCKTLQRSQYDGQRVCVACNNRKVDSRFGNAVVRFMARRVDTELRIDKLRKGYDISEAEHVETLALFEALYNSAIPDPREVEKAGMVPGLTWRDQYSGKLYSFPEHTATSFRSYPELPSTDARFPVILTEYGLRPHHPDNSSVTPQAANLAKHVQIPAFLQVLRDYVNERDNIERQFGQHIHGSRARKKLDDLESEMVERCRILRLVRLTFPWSNKARQNVVLSQDQFEKRLQPLISGKLPAGVHGPWEKSDERYIFFEKRAKRESAWPEETIARIRAIVDEIMEFFGVHLETRDGCPYFGHESSMPTDWSWDRAFALAAERHHRMTYFCNRYFPTYETPDTIFLECIFQVCIGRCVLHPKDPNYDTKKELKGKYASIFGLPLTVAFHDPLTMAVANWKHHDAMRSGWPLKPQRMSERLKADAENNMRIEARTENFAKSDYDMAKYPLIKRIIMDINLPQEVYDPSVEPSADAFNEDLDGVDWDADEDFGDYDADYIPDFLDDEDIVQEEDIIPHTPEVKGKGKEKMVSFRDPSTSPEGHQMDVDEDAQTELRAEMQAKLHELKETANGHPNNPMSNASFVALLRDLETAMELCDGDSFEAGLAVAYSDMNEGF